MPHPNTDDNGNVLFDDEEDDGVSNEDVVDICGEEVTVNEDPPRLIVDRPQDSSPRPPSADKTPGYYMSSESYPILAKRYICGTFNMETNSTT